MDFAVSAMASGNADSERLIRLQRREKLDRGYGGKARIFAPLGQRCDDFVQDYYTRHNRRAGEMPEHAGMISVDRTVNFKVHPMTFRSSRQIQQLGEPAA